MLPPQFHVYVHPTDQALKNKAETIVQKLIGFGYEPLVYLDRQPNQCDLNTEAESGLVFDGYSSAHQPYHDLATYTVNPNHYIICLQIYTGSLSPVCLAFVIEWSRHIYFNERVPDVVNPMVPIPGLDGAKPNYPDQVPEPVFHMTTFGADGSILSQENSLLSYEEHTALLLKKEVPNKRRLEIN